MGSNGGGEGCGVIFFVWVSREGFVFGNVFCENVGGKFNKRGRFYGLNFEYSIGFRWENGV